MKYELKKPIWDLTAPVKPTKPTEPATIESSQVFYEAKTGTSSGITIKLLDALKDVPANLPVENLQITLKRIGNKFDAESLKSSLVIHQSGSIANPKYEILMSEYEKALAEHQIADERYRVLRQEHLGKFSLWTKLSEYQKLKRKKIAAETDAKQIKSLSNAISKLCKSLKIDETPDNFKLV